MKKTMLLAIGTVAALSGSARADKTDKNDKTAKTAKAPVNAEKATKATKPAKMTCEDFIALEDVARPKLVYWAEGYNRKGKLEDATFDVESTDRLVPVMVEVCQKEPKASFWQKVKNEFKKVF